MVKKCYKISRSVSVRLRFEFFNLFIWVESYSSRYPYVPSFLNCRGWKPHSMVSLKIRCRIDFYTQSRENETVRPIRSVHRLFTNSNQCFRPVPLTDTDKSITKSIYRRTIRFLLHIKDNERFVGVLQKSIEWFYYPMILLYYFCRNPNHRCRNQSLK